MKKSKLFLTMFIWILLGCFSFAWGADRGEIESGETQIGFEITAPSYMDTWTFSGDTGDRVLISVVATSGSLDPYLALYPPDSGPKETYSFFGDIDHQLAQSGLYTIVIEDNGRDNEGTYNMNLLKIPGALSSPADPDGGMIASGQTLAPGGTINVNSDRV